MKKSPQTINVSTSTIFRVLLIVLVLVFLYYIRDVLLLVFVAFVLVAAISPLVDRLEKFKVPRFLSTILIYIVVFGGLAFLASLVVPPLVKQGTQFIEHFPAYWDSQLADTDVARWLGLGKFGDVPTQQALKTAGGYFSSEGFFSRAGSFLGRFLYIAVVFSLAFYMTIQKNALKKFLKAVVPEGHEAYVVSLVVRIQDKLGHWLLGQLFLNLIIGSMVYLVLYLLGIPYALLLAILAGLLEFIPTIGPVAAALLASAVALTVSPLMTLIVVAAFVVIQQLENHFIVPLVMKQAVGLNPVVIIISLLVGAKLAGPLGAVLAVPVATSLSVFVGDLIAKKE